MPPPSHLSTPGTLSSAAHKNLPAFPPPPNVPQLLNDLLVLHPAEPGSMVPPPLRPDQYPPIASVHELEDLSRAVRRCTEAASTRAGSARAALEYFGQAIKPGGSVVDPSSSLISSHKRESGTPSRRDRDDDEFEIGGSRRRNGVERHGSLVSDGPTIGRPKKSHALSHQVVAATDVGGTNRLTPGLGDSKREMEKPGRGRKAINGSAATGAASGSRNSVSPVRIKREISASPAPSTVAYNDAGSVHGSLASTSQRNKNARSPSVLSADGPDIPLSQSSGHKKKKRKIAYGDDNGASAASVDGGRSGRLGSPSASVRSNTSAQHGASVSASAKDRPVVSHQSSSNLKIKLKVGGPDAAAASLATTPEPVYHHPVINFQPPPLPTFALPPEAYRPSSSVAPPEPISLDSPSKMTNPHLPTADSLPVSSLIPTRQAVPRPPAPGPKRQKDVNQDFTQVKSVPQQTSWNTFWAGIEPYLREIGPEDLAMLRLEQDNVTPFVVPPLGKHYQDLWDEEDLNLPFGASSSSASNALGGLSASAAAAQAARESRMASRRGKFIAPRDMADDDLADDTRGLGGLTERIASAFFPDELAVKLKTEEGEKQRETEADHSHANGEKEVEPGAATVDLTSPVRETRPLADTTDRGRSPVKQEPGGDNKAEDLKITEVADDDDNDNDDLDDYQWPIAPHRIPSPARKPGERDRADVVGVDINDLEEGVKREMRLLQLIGPEEQLEPESREDDEIATALRQCQRLLGEQSKVNEERKARLAKMCEARLAYSECKQVIDGVQRVLTETWTTKVSRKKTSKKTKAQSHAPASATNGTDVNGHAISPIKPHGIGEKAKSALESRKQLLEIRSALESAPEGIFRGTPATSIYSAQFGRAIERAMDPDAAAAEAATPSESVDGVELAM